MFKKHSQDGLDALRRDLKRLAMLLDRLASLKTDQASRAATAREAHEALRAAAALSARHREHVEEAGPVYWRALERFRAAIANAYPPGFWAALQRLRNGDPAGLETAVTFLEADPWFHRSGYAKESLIRYLTRLPLSPEHARRLREVVLAAVDGRDRREFRSYCRLARKVDDPAMRAELQQRLKHDDPRVRRHARWVLAACDVKEGLKSIF